MSTSPSAKARQAFDDGRWRLRSPGERKAVLIKFAKLMEDNRHELAVMESLDSGKPVRECQTVDVPDTIHTIRWHAELIDKLYDNTAPVGLERAGHGRARAGRRRRLRAAVELPAADAGLEDRSGACRRMLGHREAGRGDHADHASCRRTGASRPVSRRASSMSSPAAARRSANRSACTWTSTWWRSPDRRRPAGASCATPRTPTSSASSSNAAARTRRWFSTTPKTSTSSPNRWSTARSGTWARTARRRRG